MKCMTWRQFLSECDVSGWRWSNIDKLHIVKEDTENGVVWARITTADIVDDSEFEVHYLDDSNEAVVRWGGDWFTIIDYLEEPEIYLRIYTEPEDNCYHCDGTFYFDIED